MTARAARVLIAPHRTPLEGGALYVVSAPPRPPLGAPLDPEQHLPLHDQRAGLHPQALARRRPLIAMRLRLISRVAPPSDTRTKVHTQSPASDRFARTRSGSRISTRIPARSSRLRSTSPTLSVCHSAWIRSALCMFQTEQILDPVIGRRRHASPICTSQGQIADAGASIPIALVATMSARSSKSSPGSRRAAAVPARCVWRHAAARATPRA
jgi:hypothetical protein